MKIAYIMRGVPGSGKSTLAERLANGNGIIYSTDDYFYVDGEYRFDPARLEEYHARNLNDFCNGVNSGITPVICDNTNVQKWQYQKYVDAAQKAGYMVAIVTMSHPAAEVAAERTLHNVPVEAIQRMLNKWEN